MGVGHRQRLAGRPHKQDDHDRQETDQAEPEEHPLVARGLRFEARLAPVRESSCGTRPKGKLPSDAAPGHPHERTVLRKYERSFKPLEANKRLTLLRSS